MAENDPNGWAKSPGFNTWGHVGVAKDNRFYQLLDEAKEKTDAIFEVVNLTFDLVNSALDFIASLLIDFSNPLKIIIEEIIALLESFISDLRNFGWYLTYDRKSLKDKKAEELLGGYPAFESRMIEKLLSFDDPTRPNFSPETKVFAMTFFAGADASGLGAIISHMKKLLKLLLSFKGESDKSEAPINLQVGYYNSTVGEIEIPNTFKPDGIRVKWNLPAPPSTNKVLPKSFIMPDYFLFSVATRKTNEKIAYINRVARPPHDLVGIDLFGSEMSTVQEFASETDARLWPLLKTDDDFTKLDESEEFGTLDEVPVGTGTKGAFVLKGNDDTLYLNKFGEQKISDVYRCFVFGGGGGGLIGDNDFSFDIPLENLKINGKLESDYYITMYSLTMETEEYESISKKKKDLPGLEGINSIRVGTHELIESGEFISLKPDGGSPFSWLEMNKGELSKPSATVVIKSPSEIRDKYLNAVKFYWIAHLLAQPYIDYHRDKLGFENPVGKEAELIKAFGEDSIYKNLYTSNQTAKQFARGIQEWLRKIMLKFKSDMPSDATLNSLKNSLDKINEFPINLEEIVKNTANGDFDSSVGGFGFNVGEFNVGGFNVGGFGFDIGEFNVGALYPSVKVMNPVSRAFLENTSIQRDALTGMITSPEYDAGTSQMFNNNIFHDAWTGSKQPWIFDSSGFIGHLFLHKDFKETFRLARRVVTLSPPITKETGQWLNQRPFRDSDLSSLTNFIDTIKKYMEGFLKGLEGIVAQILKFIHMLKTRIAQVQAIIARIKALIDLILSFRFPAGMYGTFHLADGTAGLVTALQQSQDKPDIGADGYGIGLMAVAGGVPTILIDFLIALMGGEGEE